jgi:hypothetical protein
MVNFPFSSVRTVVLSSKTVTVAKGRGTFSTSLTTPEICAKLPVEIKNPMKNHIIVFNANVLIYPIETCIYNKLFAQHPINFILFGSLTDI